MVDLANERFNEAFMESAPQAAIQIYIATIIFDSWAQIISIVISLASLSLATTDYTCYKYEANPLRRNLTVLGTTMVFLWRLPTIACRCAALGIFASQYR